MIRQPVSRCHRLLNALAATALTVAASAADEAWAQDTGNYTATSNDAVLPPVLDGARIDVIDVVLPPGSSLAQQDIRAAMQVKPGDFADPVSLKQALDRVRALEGAEASTYQLELTSNPTSTTLSILVAAGTEKAPGQRQRARFPKLIETKRAQATLILNGAFGGYVDFRPWFGDGATFTQRSPVATDPALGKSATWGEATVEFGIGGITQIGSSPVYAYGAATGMWSGAVGQDLFTGKSRSYLALEKAYVGILYADRENRRAVNLSVGRQNFNLGDGFLFAFTSGSANAGPRPALFLNPRVAFDFSVLLDIKLDRVRIKGFLLDPNELEDYESRTRFAGAHILWSPSDKASFGATYVKIERSDGRLRLPDGTSLAREGLNTYALQARLDDPAGLKGLWLQGEYAWQRNGGAVRTWSGYATLGYRFGHSPVKPAISYRFSAFSGDDPSTPAYERYDPLLSGGLGEWVQGVNFKKVIGNTNVDVHRLRFSAKPTPKLNVTLDAFHFRARELNNLGGNPALSALGSHDLGEEYTLRLDWTITPTWYVLGVISHARPGKALQLASPLDLHPWTTLQASAFWRF